MRMKVKMRSNDPVVLAKIDWRMRKLNDRTFALALQGQRPWCFAVQYEQDAGPRFNARLLVLGVGRSPAGSIPEELRHLTEFVPATKFLADLDVLLGGLELAERCMVAAAYARRDEELA